LMVERFFCCPPDAGVFRGDYVCLGASIWSFFGVKI